MVIMRWLVYSLGAFLLFLLVSGGLAVVLGKIMSLSSEEPPGPRRIKTR